MCMYTYFIRPILEYASPVWDNLSAAQTEMLERIQYQALLVISGCRQGTKW